jgi:hypothetical protein
MKRSYGIQLILGFTIVGLVSCARTGQVDVLRANRFELIDETGRVRATLAIDAVPVHPQYEKGEADATSPTRRQVSLTFFDDGGNRRAAVGLHYGERGFLRFEDRLGQERIVLDDGPSMTILKLSNPSDPDHSGLVLWVDELGSSVRAAAGSGKSRYLDVDRLSVREWVR